MTDAWKGGQTERCVLHYWKGNDGTGGVLKANKKTERKGKEGKET